MKKYLFRILVAGLLLGTPYLAYAELREEVIPVSSRPGITLPYLLTSNVAAEPAWIFVLLSGGFGEHNLTQRGEVIQVYNELHFLARTRQDFAAGNAVAALVDVPSDRSRLSDDFRASEAHSLDISAVVIDLQQRYPRARVVLIGHSNGAISAAYAALRLGVKVEKLVLISGRLVAHWYGGDALSKFDFSGLKPHMLLVHHILDGCSVTPYSGSQALSDRFPLMTVKDSGRVEIGSCSSAGTHNLNGKEKAVVDAIRAWVSDAPWPREIE